MIKQYLRALAVSCSLISVSFSQDYNARLLDINSEELNTKILSKATVSKNMIQESLNFIYKPENLEEKGIRFGELRTKMTSLISDRNFISFADTCQGVYEEGTEETKIAISMLFESVSDKYHTQFKRFQKLKRIKDQETGSTHNERPWKDTIVQGKIEKSLMADFFRGYPIFDFINALQSFSYEGLVQITNSVRSSLMHSSKSQLEEYQGSLENLRSKVPQKILERANVDYLIFEGQTADQAFLGTFFFPDLLEKGFDHSLIYFQHQTIPTLLAFSAHYQNPIAFFYHSKMFQEFDYEDAADHFLEAAKLSFTNTLAKQVTLSSTIQNKDLMGICHFYISEIFAQQGEYPNSREALSQAASFLSQSENPEYLVQIAKRITDTETKKAVLLKAYSAREGDAGVLLASLEKAPEGKKRKLHEAFSMGSAQAGHTLGGLLLQETPNSPEAISYLKDAIKRGSFGAALTLAKAVPSEAENAYSLASNYGFQYSHYLEYQRLLTQGNNESAKESLSRAGIILRDETLLEIFPVVERDRVYDDLETYWENLSKIVDFNVTSCESIASNSVEMDELSDLMPDEDDKN